MQVFARQIVDGRVRCPVSVSSANQLSWEAEIKSADDFEKFIKKIARAWAIAETEKEMLTLSVHQVNPSDVGE